MINFNIDGKVMIQWMKDLWEYPRSITSYGTRKTLDYLKNINKDLRIYSFKSGEKVFDWYIPDEWNFYNAYIEHESGKRFAESKINNLHVMGYSVPVDKKLSLDDLQSRIYTEPDQPDVIPYVTSYYSDNWGFCMSGIEKEKLPDGQYHVVIEAKKRNMSVLQLALSFVQSIDEIDKVIVGVNTLRQLQEVVSAASIRVNTTELSYISIDDPAFINPVNWKT